MEKQLIFTPKTFFVEAPFYLVAGDVQAYTLVFHAPEHIEGTMTVNAIRADGETVADIIEVSGKVVRYTMFSSMYEVEGPLSVRIMIQSGDTVLTSNEISFEVLPAANNSTMKADDRYPALTALILHTQSAAISAEMALKKIQDVQNKLIPDSTLQDTGKILYLRKKDNAELEYFTVDLESHGYYITDAGILNNETAFVEVDEVVFQQAGLTDPTHESCAFGITFIPSNLDTSTDYDVIVDEVSRTASGYMLSFPLSQCPLMENATEDNLFSLFESAQLNGEYIKEETEAIWVHPEDALPGTFLDEYVISPAFELSKNYTNQQTQAVISDMQEALNRRISQNENNMHSVLVSGGEQEKSSTDEIEEIMTGPYTGEYEPNLTIIGNLTVEMESGNIYEFFNPETGERLMAKYNISFPTDDKFELEMVCAEDLTPGISLEQFKEKYPFYRVYNETRWQTAESFLQPAKAYTDTVVQQAILDSWEVAV